MRLLITGGDSLLARAAMAALVPGHCVRAIDTVLANPLPEGLEAREGDLRDPAFVSAALEGVDAIPSPAHR